MSPVGDALRLRCW